MSKYKLSEVSSQSEWEEVVSAIEDMVSNNKDFIINIHQKKKDFKSLVGDMVIECPVELLSSSIAEIMRNHNNLKFGEIPEDKSLIFNFLVISPLP